MLETTAYIVEIIVGIVIAASIGFFTYCEYKKLPAKDKQSIKAEKNTALWTAIQTAKSMLKSEVIAVARDVNLPSGASKKEKAVKDIMTMLKLAGFNNVPEIIVSKLVEAAYQTYADFIQSKGLDSRTQSVGTPNQLNADQLKKRLP